MKQNEATIESIRDEHARTVKKLNQQTKSLQQDVEVLQSVFESESESSGSSDDSAEDTATKASDKQVSAMSAIEELAGTPSSATKGVPNKKFEEVALGLTRDMKDALFAADAAVAKAKQEQAAALSALEKGRADVESMLKQMQKAFAMLPIGQDFEADANNNAVA